MKSQLEWKCVIPRNIFPGPLRSGVDSIHPGDEKQFSNHRTSQAKRVVSFGKSQDFRSWRACRSTIASHLVTDSVSGDNRAKHIFLNRAICDTFKDRNSRHPAAGFAEANRPLFFGMPFPGVTWFRRGVRSIACHSRLVERPRKNSTAKTKANENVALAA